MILPSLLVFVVTAVNFTTLFFYLIYHSNVKNYSKSLPEVKKLSYYPKVSIHISIRNEPMELVERVARKCLAIEYPAKKLQVIIVSDDDEGYLDCLSRRLGKIRTKAELMLVRREKSSGFKAGKLNEALKRTDGEYVAVLDVDSVPPRNFLLDTLPYLEADKTGAGKSGGGKKIAAVECRWRPVDYENTRVAQAVGRGTLYFEEILWKGRQASGFQPNLYGNGCVIRKSALEKVGGWDGRYMLEDVELGTRFLLNGRKILYLERPSVGIDIPKTYEVFKLQQARWVYGSVELLKKKMKDILKSKLRVREKIEALFLLSQYSNFIINFLPLVVFVPYFLLGFDLDLHLSAVFLNLAAFMSLQGFGMVSFLRKRGVSFKSAVCSVGRASGISYAMAPTLLFSILKSLVGLRHFWVVTPKGRNEAGKSTMKDLKLETLTAFILFALSAVAYLRGSALFTPYFLANTLIFAYAVFRAKRNKIQNRK